MSIAEKLNSPSLTERQSEVYAYVSKRSRDGFAPTVREIGKHFGIKSPNGVVCHLRALEKKGVLIRERHLSRGIRVTARGMRFRGEVS